MYIKAITLSDISPRNPYPWLSLIEYRLKTLETRTRRTHFRGDLLLCGAADSRTDNRGLACCVVEVVDCWPMRPQDEPAAYIGCQPGRWAWKLENLRWLSEKFPVTGKQGFFYVELPPALTLITPSATQLEQVPHFLLPLVDEVLIR